MKMMNRRKFLKWIGIGTGVAVVAPKVLLSEEDNFYFKGKLRDKIKARIVELENNPSRIFQFGWDDGWVRNGDICRCEDGHRYICQIHYRMKNGRYLVSEARVLSRITNDVNLIKVIKEKESKLWFHVMYSDDMPAFPNTEWESFPLEALTRGKTPTELEKKKYKW